VTAHIYADLYDDELDVVESALDALDDRRLTSPNGCPILAHGRRLKPPTALQVALKTASELVFTGGPGWYRTSDLPRVRRTLSH
jgi:hypothetical protein